MEVNLTHSSFGLVILSKEFYNSLTLSILNHHHFIIINSHDHQEAKNSLSTLPHLTLQQVATGLREKLNNIP